VAGAAALGADGPAALAARALAVALLAFGALASLRWAIGSASAGASDASGIAAMLTAAEQLAAQLPPDVELWCAATGAEHTDRAACTRCSRRIRSGAPRRPRS
jgi:hypothetical protein